MNTSAYWDQVFREKGLKDNIHKRQEVVSRIMNTNHIGARVLEVGCGVGVAASAVLTTLLGSMLYVGTDVSSVAVEAAKTRFMLNTFHTDMSFLPRIEGGYTRIWLFDVLEHIPYDERKQGYKQLREVMADNCVVLINAPWATNPSQHDPNFDFKWDLKDLQELVTVAGLEVIKIDVYQRFDHSYYWIEARKGA